MRLKENNGDLTIWLSANDTYNWARNWPASELSNKRLMAQFDYRGNLIDVTIDGRSGDCPLDEFNSICYDHIKQKYPNHPVVKNLEAYGYGK